MSDLVDRNLIGDLVDSHGNVHYEDIMSLPPAQQWIPCKDRLPDRGVDVFVTWINGVDIAYWDVGEDGRYWDFKEFYLGECDGEFADVIAWMPLPKPYKEDEA